jgi:putative transposon-encoded protein
MVRRMKTKQIESKVTRIGNGAHVLVPKDWLGKEVIVKIKEK